MKSRNILAAVLLLCQCGCGHTYFAWKKPLPAEDHRGVAVGGEGYRPLFSRSPLTSIFSIENDPNSDLAVPHSGSRVHPRFLDDVLRSR